VSAVGVEDDKDPYFDDGALAQIGSVVSTYDPHRVLVFQTKHALPLIALQAADTYEDVYKRHVRDKVIPGEEPTPYTFPELQGMNRENKLCFALGMAFGNIHRKDDGHYYCQRPRAFDQPVKLADTVAMSLRHFARREELVNECRESVDAKWRVEKETAVTQIGEFRQKLERSLSDPDLSVRERRTREELMALLADHLRLREGL
jgi:hypothetical protein